MSDVLWQLKNAGLTTRGHGRLFDLTIGIHTGTTAVLGESGAGKTSLLNLLVGIDEPTSGWIDAIAAQSATQAKDRPFVYWVPQDHGLWPHLSVEAHLAMVAPASQADGGWALLETFALADRRDANPAELSQGERARLSVARALATGAQVQVMDEPLAHVDAARRPTFWSAIEQHIKQAGSSWVFATHDPQTVLAHAEHVIALDQGALLFHGPVAALYHNPPTEQAARCMGEVNWLMPDDAKLWLINPPDWIETPARPCFRPEHLQIRLDPASPLAVESFVFRGPTSHVKLKHTANDRSRHFAIRSPKRALKAGDHVSLHSVRDGAEVGDG